MMSAELHTVMLITHIAFGFASLVLGSVAVLLPKFARSDWRHRWVGRVYAVAMLIQASLSIPLAWEIRSYVLLVIGVFTLLWVTGGWIAVRKAVRAGPNGARIVDMGKLRLHFTFMGSSYIGAWTAFLVNAGPFAENPVLFTAYAAVPSIIGSVLIGRASARHRSRRLAALHAAPPSQLDFGPNR